MIIFLFSVALLVFVWLVWAIKGPQIYYNYRSEIVINAPITTVWKAINKSSDNFQSYSLNNKYSERDTYESKIIISHIENEIQKYNIEERVLSAIERSLIKTRIEKSGDEPFPVGKDSFEQIELFGKAPW